MIQLQVVMWTMALFFSYIGYQRGWNKEIISTSGIILALFALHQFDTLIRGVLLANLPGEQRFIVQTLFFVFVVYFAYQTRALVGGRGNEGRDSLQERVLGGIIGFVNGYLVWGSLWYFLDINNYPAGLLVTPPADRANVVATLPLYLLAGGPAGPGDLLSLIVIVLFLVVLIVI